LYAATPSKRQRQPHTQEIVVAAIFELPILVIDDEQAAAGQYPN
jgi:hypothetical protein